MRKKELPNEEKIEVLKSLAKNEDCGVRIFTEIVSDDPGVQIGNHNKSKIFINDNDEIFIIEEKSPIDSLIEMKMTNRYLKEKSFSLERLAA